MISGRSSAPVLLFGMGSNCDVTAGRVQMNEEAQAAFHLSSPWGSAEVQLAIHGEHQVANALGAMTAALWAGVSLDHAVESIARVEDPPWRMNVALLRGGVILVNDSYNANPTSTEAALRALRALPGDRRIAILGGMAELGEGSDELHRSISTIAEALGIALIGYQTLAYGNDAVSNMAELIDRLDGLHAGDAILVKGSRASGMESVAEWLERSLDAPGGC
jgi:UDP-N-acetylmuramoyl-tripeptide--D-alanyl-D-alanine ligase